MSHEREAVSPRVRQDEWLRSEGLTRSDLEALTPEERKAILDKFSDVTKYEPLSEDLGEYRVLERTVGIPIDWLQWLLIIKLLKTPEGMRFLDRFMHDRHDSITDICQSLAQATAGNPAAAFGNGHLIAQILEHNYYIRKGGPAGWINSMSWLTGFNAVSKAITDVVKAIGGAYKDIQGAQTIIYAAREKEGDLRLRRLRVGRDYEREKTKEK